MAAYRLYRPWSPQPRSGFDDLRRDMEALLGRFGAEAPARGVFPPVNLYESGDAYVVTAELPGVSASDIEVSLEGSTLTLRGEKKIDTGSEPGTAVHRRERQSGGFRRAFELPAEIDAEKVEAVQRSGVLMLRLPKAPQHRPRQISVQAG
jgi:HSP20 family protein